MVKKIELKIFLIIFILLSVMVGTIIAYNTYATYKSTVRGITLYIEKIYDDNKNKGKEIDGFYRFRVKDYKVMYGNSEDEQLKEYAIKIAKQDSDCGIIEDYIYRNKSIGKDKKRRCYNTFRE